MSTAVLARPPLQRTPLRVHPQPTPLASAQNSASPASPARKSLLNFARTKIQPPRARPGALLQRPALQQCLVHSLSTMPLVLVCATAGFGKTSALTQAIDQLQASPEGTAVAWVGCDEGDTPLQLFSCLVAALEPFDLPWRASPDSLISAALSGHGDEAAQRKALRAMVTELINALDAADVAHGVIVVDDLHRIDHPAVFQFLDLLLERFTPRWTMAIATRHEPPIALARYRARGEIAEFRLDDLRFDAAQARALATTSGLDNDVADALCERTQGWPAGLQLALSVLRNAPGATLAGHAALIDRQVFDFLATEVLDRLPRELREFLITTSVLPELTAARCAALTGNTHAAEHLDAIERAGLFVTTLPEPEPTLRLHDLLRDALEHRLLRERPQELPQLLARAAKSEPDGVRRLGYWLRAERWDQAARELHLQTYDLLTASQTATVERWLARFPEPLRHSQPDLLLVRTLVSWMHWRWRDMIAAAQAAAERFEQQARPLDAMAARAYGVLALRGGGQRDASDALAQRLNREVDALLAERAAEMQAGKRWDGHEPGIMAALLGRESVVWAAFDDARLDDLAEPTERSIDLLDHASGVAPFFQMLPLPAYVGLRGMQPALARYVRKARQRLTPDDAHLGTLVQALDGSLRVWAGDVAAGRTLLREAAAEVRWHDFPLRSTDHVYPFLCIADVLLGDTAALADDAAVLELTLMRASELPDIGHRVASELFFVGRWLYAGGQTESALRLWHRVARWDDPRTRPLWRVQMSTLPAFVALAEGRLADAERGFAAALAAHGQQLDLQGQWTELRLRSADLRWRLGRSAYEAAALLTPLFARHANDTDITSVLLVGPDTLRALAQARWGSALSVDQVAALTRWADRAAALRPGSQAVARPLSTPPSVLSLLSDREAEVLARLAAGDSNKLIARAFDLSPHTVKRHVANILDKLDLRSRGQAAAWFHERHA
jgi:LuxR family transcriptional regulator, maltose regulon positive regulatory protein